MRPGQIRLERASRCFRVYPKPVPTLKDLVVHCGRVRGEDVWGLREVSARVEPGEAVGVAGRNGSGKSTLLLPAGMVETGEGSWRMEHVGAELEAR